MFSVGRVVEKLLPHLYSYHFSEASLHVPYNFFFKQTPGIFVSHAVRYITKVSHAACSRSKHGGVITFHLGFS